MSGIARWSTPKRCVGIESLSDIPPDVYLEILDHVQTSEQMGNSDRRQALLNLSSVCRGLYALSAPRIFKSLIFSLRRDDHETSLPSYMEFCSGLIWGQYSPPWVLDVKDCRFVQWSAFPQSDNFKGLYAHAVTRLTNLSSISFSRCPISSIFLEAMGSLKNLKSISFRDCNFDPDVTDGTISQISDMRLSTFELLNCKIGSVVETLADVISTPQLRILRTNMWDFLGAVMNRSMDFHIEKLAVELHTIGISTFCEFLGRTPSITDLEISAVISTVAYGKPPTSILKLPQSALPGLRALKCPPCLLLDLALGRSLSQADVSGDVCDPVFRWQPLVQVDWGGTRWMSELYPGVKREASTDLSSLGQATTITELHIYEAAYLDHPFVSIFPNLDVLHLYCDVWYYRGPQRLYELCDRWPETPPIRYLFLDFNRQTFWPTNHLDLPNQHEMIISGFAVAFPTLMCLRMTQHIEWRREDELYSHWQPIVLPQSRDIVKESIKSTYVPPPGHWYGKVKDFGGCLAALFETHELDDSLRSKLERIKTGSIRISGLPYPM